MNKKIIWIIALILLSGCAAGQLSAPAGDVVLTPYYTDTSSVPLAATLQPPSGAETVVPLPTPTPTQFIHTVALGETISSIALRYGLDMGAVQAANPDVNPNTLIVGMQLIIPQGETAQIGGLPVEPLALTVLDPACRETPEGGLWCHALVINPFDQPAGNISLAFTLQNGGGDTRSQTVPALMNRLEPGDYLPVTAYFSPPQEAAVYTITAELVSALPLEDSGYEFLPAEPLSAEIQLQGKYAQVSGEVNVGAQTGENVAVWVGAAALDDAGRLLGVRRMEYPVQLEESKIVSFKMIIYSAGADIAEVRIYAEAILSNQ